MFGWEDDLKVTLASQHHHCWPGKAVPTPLSPAPVSIETERERERVFMVGG